MNSKRAKRSKNFINSKRKKADLVPYRHKRVVISDADLALSTDQLYQQVLRDHDDIAQRDAVIQRLQQQVLDTAGDLLETRISTFEQHFDLCREFDPDAGFTDERD
jgi:hypothetical protein